MLVALPKLEAAHRALTEPIIAPSIMWPQILKGTPIIKNTSFSRIVALMVITRNIIWTPSRLANGKHI